MSILTKGLNLFNHQISNIVKGMLQGYLEEYGRISDLKIDFKARTIEAKLDLAGEKESISISVKGVYSHREDGVYYLVFDEISVSRDWLDKLAAQYLPKVMPQKRIEIPGNMGKIIAKVL